MLYVCMYARTYVQVHVCMSECVYVCTQNLDKALANSWKLSGGSEKSFDAVGAFGEILDGFSWALARVFRTLGRLLGNS